MLFKRKRLPKGAHENPAGFSAEPKTRKRFCAKPKVSPGSHPLRQSNSAEHVGFKKLARVFFQMMYENLYRQFGIENAVKFLGDPWNVAKANLLLRQNKVNFSWMKEKGKNGKIDIALKISGNGSDYTIICELDRLDNYDYHSSFPKNMVGFVKQPKHHCDDIGWKSIKKGFEEDYKCKHLITMRLKLERELQDYSRDYYRKKRKNEFLTIQQLYKEYENPNLFFVSPEYSDFELGTFRMIDKSWRIKAEDKRILFYQFLRNEKQATKV